MGKNTRPFNRDNKRIPYSAGREDPYYAQNEHSVNTVAPNKDKNLSVTSEPVVKNNVFEQPSTAYTNEEKYETGRSSYRTRKKHYSPPSSKFEIAQIEAVKELNLNKITSETNERLLANAIEKNRALRSALNIKNEEFYFMGHCYNYKSNIQEHLKKQQNELNRLYAENETLAKQLEDVTEAHASEARENQRNKVAAQGSNEVSNPVQVAPVNVNNIEAAKREKWTFKRLEEAEGTEQVELTAVKGASNEGDSYSKPYTTFKDDVKKNILAPLDAQRMELEKRIEKGELSKGVKASTLATIKEIETTIDAIICTVIQTKEVLTTKDAKPFDPARLKDLTFTPNETRSKEQTECESRANVISHQQEHIAAHINNIMLNRDSATTKNRDSTVRDLAKKLVNFLGCVTIVPVLASAVYSKAKYSNFDNILFFSPTKTAKVAEKVAEDALSHTSASPPPVILNNK